MTPRQHMLNLPFMAQAFPYFNIWLTSSAKSTIKATLPHYFTNIIPVKGGKSEYPNKTSSSQSINSDHEIINESAAKWLEALKKNCK